MMKMLMMMMMFRSCCIVLFVVTTAKASFGIAEVEKSQQQQKQQHQLRRKSMTNDAPVVTTLENRWEEESLLTWEHSGSEQPSLLLRQEPTTTKITDPRALRFGQTIVSSSSSSSSPSPSDVTIINNCGTRISNFKVFYNVDFSSYKYEQASTSLDDGQSITLSSVGSTDDTLLRYYAIDVVYDGKKKDFVLTEIPTKVTTTSTLFSRGVNFRLRSGTTVNFPIYATDVRGLSQYGLCGNTDDVQQEEEEEDPINVPVGMPVGPSATTTTTTTTSTTTTTTTSTTTTPQASSTSEAEALASCSKANNKVWCEEWLTAHNTRRAAFHASYDMTPSLLTWDVTLENDAQDWAETFLDGDACTFGHDPDSLSGENLALNAGTGSYAQARTPEDVLVAWWDEEYPLTQPPSNTLRGAGHFTQAAWYKSTKLGCGMITKEATFTSSRGNTVRGACHVQVCRYGDGRGNCNLRFNNWETTVLTGRTC